MYRINCSEKFLGNDKVTISCFKGNYEVIASSKLYGDEDPRIAVLLKDSFERFFPGIYYPKESECTMFTELCANTVYSTDWPPLGLGYPDDFTQEYSLFKDFHELMEDGLFDLMDKNTIVFVNQIQGTLSCVPFTFNSEISEGYHIGQRFVCNAFSYNRLYTNDMECIFDVYDGEILDNAAYRVKLLTEYYNVPAPKESFGVGVDIREYTAYLTQKDYVHDGGLWDIYDGSFNKDDTVPVLWGLEGKTVEYVDLAQFPVAVIRCWDESFNVYFLNEDHSIKDIINVSKYDFKRFIIEDEHHWCYEAYVLICNNEEDEFQIYSRKGELISESHFNDFKYFDVRTCEAMFEASVTGDGTKERFLINIDGSVVKLD